MKILAFFGGARKKGITKAMLDYLLENLEGEKEIINCYSLKISPCVDCRYCYKHRACCLDDEMVDIYKKIDDADVIIYAAPVYFLGTPGMMKVMMDRFQMYWASEIRGDEPSELLKKGAIISSAGSPNFKNLFKAINLEMGEALRVNGARKVGQVLMDDADDVICLDQRPEIKEELLNLASLLSENNE